MRKILWAMAGVVLTGLVLALGAALAQVPGLFIVSPTGAEQINVLNAGPQIATVFLTQARDTAGYQKVVPTTGQTFATPANVSVIQATPAGTLSTWTVTTPTVPFDGQRLQIFTTQTVTTFNLTAATGQTVNGNLAGTLSANSNVEYLYSLSNKTWDRIQ